MKIIKLVNPYNEYVKNEGAILLPRNLQCNCKKYKPEEILKKLGFLFLGPSEKYSDMMRVKLPEGWSTREEGIRTISIIDKDNCKRAEIIFFYDREYQSVIHTMANLFCRYEYNISIIQGNVEIVFTDMKTKKGYLIPKSRRYISDKIQVIEYEKLNYCVEDELALEEAYQVLYELNEYFPGWDNPINWDKNPLEKMFK